MQDASQQMLTFGRSLARLRVSSGMTQERLAEVAAIHPRYLQKLEAGTTSPTLLVLWRLKKALGVDWDVLLARLR